MNRIKKAFRILLLGLMVLSMVVGTSQMVMAKKKKTPKNYMKNLKVSFDLKKNKEVTYKEIFPSVGKKDASAKITNYEITDAKTKGYKTLHFTYTSKHEWKPKSSDVHKIIQSDYFDDTEDVGGQSWYTIVDYNSGENLEVHNDYDVKVESGKVEYSKEKSYVDRDGCEVIFKNTKINVTVTYPITYKGLCIGVGGFNQLKISKNDKAYWKGNVTFGKTSYYTEGKKNSHFMRVTK